MTYNEQFKTKTITGTFFLSLQPVSTMLIGFLIIHAISKNISAEDLGIFSFLSMLYNWYANIFLLMIHGAITKYVSEYIGREDKQKIKNLIKTNTTYILLVAPATTFIAFFMTMYIFNILLLKIDLFTILIFCLATGSSIVVILMTALGRGLQKLRKVGINSFIGTIIAQTITWVLLISGFGISSLIFRWLLANVIISFLLIISDRSLISLKGDFFPFRKLVNFGFPIFLASMIAFVGQQSFLRIVLKNSFSLNEVGYFEFGMRLSVLVSTLALGYQYALTPYFATDYGYGGEQLLSENLGWTIKFGSFVFSLMIISSVTVGKIIFDIIFNEYLPAYPFFVVLVFGLWPVLLFRPFAAVLMAVGHPEKLLIARIISTIFGVPLAFILIRLGALGITLVWVFMDTVLSGLIFVFSRRYVKIRVNWKKTLKLLISAILVIPAVIVEIHFLQDFTALFVVILTNLIIYIVLVRTLGLITEREVSIALAFMPEGLRKKIARILSKY
ncbi:MAG: oligosaccharide flippase family protein [Candidatus Heimdallarchaeota archaeon]